MEERVIPDIIDDLFSPQGSYLENFMLISSVEVCQEGGCPRAGLKNYLKGTL